MAPKSKPLTELGGVDAVDGLFRADVRYRAASGQQVHIHGPRREQRRRAETDLDRNQGCRVGRAGRFGLKAPTSPNDCQGVCRRVALNRNPPGSMLPWPSEVPLRMVDQIIAPKSDLEQVSPMQIEGH